VSTPDGLVSARGPRSGLRVFDPPPRSKPTKGERTRLRILEIAATLFVERGYFGVSVRDVAAAAGITNRAVYGHFKTKGHLLVEVIRWKIAERDDATDYEAVQDADSGVGLLYDPAGRDTRLLEVDAAAAARHDPDVAAGLAALYRERRVQIEQMVIDLSSDVEALAWFITTVGAGIGVREAAGIPLPKVKRMHATISAAFEGVLQDLR